MSATAETQQVQTKPATSRGVFILRFSSTLVLWTVALLIAFSGFELAFWGLISAFGLISLWEFYGMLDQRGLPNFKLTAMICGAAMLCGSFYYFSHFGLANSYEFETAVLLLFLLTVITRQMFARLREDEPLQSMAYTLFGLLYVLWLFNFMTKILYVVPRSETVELDMSVDAALKYIISMGVAEPPPRHRPERIRSGTDPNPVPSPRT